MLFIILLLLPTISSCELRYGDNDAEVKIAVFSDYYSEKRVKNYVNFVRKTMQRTEFFDTLDIAYYTGKDCKLNYNDVRINLRPLPKRIKGLAMSGFCWDDGECYVGEIDIQKKNRRVLVHEMGHAFSLRHNDVKRSYMHKKGHGRYWVKGEINKMRRYINNGSNI